MVLERDGHLAFNFVSGWQDWLFVEGCMRLGRQVAVALCVAVAGAGGGMGARGANPVVVQNQAGFEGMEEPSVIYFPDTDTFQNDSYANHVDKGGGWFR